VFSRNVNAPGPGLLLVLAILACASGAGCNLKKKKKAPDTAPSVSTATTEGAALTGVPMNTAPPVDTPAAVVDPLSVADRALVDQTKDTVRDLNALVKKGLLTDPAKPEGDVTTRCATVESARPRIETLPDEDGELKKLVAETRRLCSFEVPILNCNHALRQASLSPSQASHRLMCGFAQKDFDKARAAKPNDRRTFELGQRMATTCK
jgi:hypothetical protein